MGEFIKKIFKPINSNVYVPFILCVVMGVYICDGILGNDLTLSPGRGSAGVGVQVSLDEHPYIFISIMILFSGIFLISFIMSISNLIKNIRKEKNLRN